MRSTSARPCGQGSRSPVCASSKARACRRGLRELRLCICNLRRDHGRQLPDRRRHPDVAARSHVPLREFAMSEAQFDARLENHEEVVKEAFVVVHEKMKTSWASAIAVFGDRATPEHAFEIFDRMEECAAEIDEIDESEVRDE